MKNLTLCIIILATIAISTSCRKDKVITDASAKLNFSTDSILFDTVFSTIGSFTKRFRVYNNNNDAILISSINVKGGTNSQFRINVDGYPGNKHNNIEIPGKDSIYVFAEVTVDPGNVNNPFVIEDAIEFVTNGNKQQVKLVAWGQDAHYYTPKRYVNGLPPYSCLDGDCDSNNVTRNWINDKPYLIYGYLVIDSSDVLTIDPGVRIHFHNNSGLWVYKDGSLNVNGTVSDPVTFQGDRLEYAYQNISGQWDRIWVNEGVNDVVFNNAVIKNGFIGIQAETLPFYPNTPISNNTLRLNNTIIQNSLIAGVLAKNFKIIDTNSAIVNSGQYNLIVQGGGEYTFNHTTFGNFWSESSRETPSIFLQNYYTDINGATQVRDIVKTDFKNCIIEGNLENEFDTDKHSSGNLNFLFDYCLLRTTRSTSGASFNNIIKNPSNQVFEDGLNRDFTLKSGSPAINAGNPALGVLTDIKGNIRDANPDLGAYEK